MLSKLAFDALCVGVGAVNLVDDCNDWDARCLGVVDGLGGLGHDAIVGGNDEDGYVRGLGPASAHGGEGFVAGGIQERDDVAAVLGLVGADVLGDAAGLMGDDVGLANGVQEGGLAVVDMAKDGHDRGFGD